MALVKANMVEGEEDYLAKGVENLDKWQNIDYDDIPVSYQRSRRLVKLYINRQNRMKKYMDGKQQTSTTDIPNYDGHKILVHDEQ